MPLHPNVRVCTHIKVTGVRCGSPALRDERFCYFHQRMFRGVPTPPEARLHPVALIENEEAIQSSLMEVINALARNTIDLRRADLILRALFIAVKNSRRVRFDMFQNDMVREVPEYPVPPPAPAAAVPAPQPAMDAESAPTLEASTETTSNVEDASPDPPLSQTLQGWEAWKRLEENIPVDPTQRKPPARAGAPAQKRKVAVNARTTRKGG